MLIPTNAPPAAVHGGRGIALTWFLVWRNTWRHLGWQPYKIEMHRDYEGWEQLSSKGLSIIRIIQVLREY